jgi:hypothetical protein
MRKCIQELREKYPKTPYIETSCLMKINLQESMILGIKELFHEKKQSTKKDGCLIN